MKDYLYYQLVPSEKDFKRLILRDISSLPA